MKNTMHTYRTHTCGQLRAEHAGQTVRLSGWVHRRRDHGQLLFIDLRDTYGLTQCVAEEGSAAFAAAQELKNEYVVTVTGKVVARTPETVNDKLPTGAVELQIEQLEIQSRAESLPLQVNSDEDYGEESRMKYRFLDLRRERMQRNMRLRSGVIAHLRKAMMAQDFTEFQTPILTASSPEGARDFLVPARLHPGKFYALPQAPQQFKQLLMVAGFDRYFQIAPCFRDEDSRADRASGEFYQLDLEMSFVTQEDVFATIEPVLHGLFEEFSNFTGTKKSVTPYPFPRITYDDAMLKYGSDKPDLRNPLKIVDVTSIFQAEDIKFPAFKGKIVRAIRVQEAATKPRSFFDKLDNWAKGEGAPGLGYVKVDKAVNIEESSEFESGVLSTGSNFNPETFTGFFSGPIAKFLSSGANDALRNLMEVKKDDVIFFIADSKELKAAKFAGAARTKIAQELGLINNDEFNFCWIVDFPMYESDEDTGKIDFSHNPFSMPQAGLKALMEQDPLTVTAFQYDIVCNGIELISGAIRNHLPDVMYKAFEIAGYDRSVLEDRFGGMLSAFKLGAPPHGGCALGLDRTIMLLADEPNIREVILFPLNQRAEDLMMQAPSEVSEKQLRELHIKIDAKPKAA